MTHEVGHYLNLRHIWGDGGCNVDDFVSDTPTSDAPNYGCDIGHISCNTTDMPQNYMDYSDDACMNLFTQGQRTRMRALFDAGGARESLLYSGACGAPPVPTCDDGIQNGNETGVDCGGPDCPACPPCSDVTVSITLDNYPEETSWTITNSSGQTVASGGTYGSQPDGSTVVSTPCLEDGCYTFTINDTYGDGICCSYGNGSYTVTDPGGTVVASGGSFGSSESTNFCISDGPAPTCSDGIQNGNETGVDCGGPDCAPCATCNDGVQNGNETGVDCGGPDCAPCASCNDGVQNGNETGVDCGGPDCGPCVTCNDGIQNGDETGVDCGGSSCPACPTGCQENTVTLSITFDNYPEETSWTVTNAGGATVASGGTYGSEPDGSTLTEELCLADGCYTFTINDSYGDGICCAYGNGSYNLTDASGTLASGGSFGSSESTSFCVGGTSGPSCSDGIQNGDETGVDCGGSCAPCDTGGGCTTVLIDEEDFESGFGIWNDGGSDCARVSSTTYANSGVISVRLRDNTNSSVMTTDNLALGNYEEVTIDFSYIANSMEQGEDFWLQASTDGGNSYQTLATWARGTDFNNNVRYNESIVITGTFTNSTRFRFRCDASANADQVYIDDVIISGCANNNRQSVPEVGVAESLSTENTAVGAVNIAPNPTRDLITVTYELTNEQSKVSAQLTDLTGRLVMQQQWPTTVGTHRQLLDLDGELAGVYLLRLITAKGQQTFKVVKVD
ncbi:MAG: T9SS C-terminal target domain-containing protein [Bacteroidetes bacterium]|nr:MAG: T9SS C-terminal target domain-containing protein [Bacteroidota bacterium]